MIDPNSMSISFKYQLEPEAAAFIQMWGAELPENVAVVEKKVTAPKQDPMQKMAAAFAAEHLGEIQATAAGGQTEATLEPVTVQGEALTETEAAAVLVKEPKTMQPRPFAVEGKSDPESLQKMNTKSFGRRELDIGRYTRMGQISVVVNGALQNSAGTRVERMRQTLDAFAKVVALDDATKAILLQVDQMQLGGMIDPEKTQAHFDSNAKMLEPYTSKAGPLHNAVSQGVMIDLGNDALTVCKEKVGVLQGGDHVTITVENNSILVQHDIKMHGKVYSEKESKEVADPKGPKQFIGRTSMEGKIGADGKITWDKVVKSLHILPNGNLDRKEFIRIQDDLNNAGLLSKDQKELLAEVKNKKTGEESYLFAHATKNPIYGLHKKE